jgi:hypothetical protein
VVAHLKRYEGDLVVTFSRDGETDERRLAPNPERAMSTALMVIAARGALYPGDMLLVTEYTDGPTEEPGDA